MLQKTSSFDFNFNFLLAQTNEIILSYRKMWNGLILSEVKSSFDSLSVLPYLNWFFHLRGSELFLALWKSIGNMKELHVS
jgi:hypothetical protein